MTAACAPGVGCQRACLRAKQAATGVYTIELPAFRVCEGACTCEGADGVCSIFEPVEVAEPTTFVAALSYPDVTAIDLVIDGP